MTQRRNRNQQTPQSTKKRAIIGVISLILIALLYVQLTSPEMLRSAPEFPSFDFDTKFVDIASKDIQSSYSKTDLAYSGIGDTLSVSDDLYDSSGTNDSTPKIAISSLPDGAKIYMVSEKDILIGTTVGTKYLVIGVKLDTEYTIKATKEGYEDLTEKVTVTEDSQDLTEIRTFKLSTANPDVSSESDSTASQSSGTTTSSSPDLYTVFITSDVSVDMFVENEPVAENKQSHAIKLSPGTYLVQATKDGYELWEDDNVVIDSSDKYVTIKMVPTSIKSIAEASAPSGEEAVTSQMAEDKQKASFTITDVYWSKSGDKNIYPSMLNVAKGSWINVWATVVATTPGIINPSEFGMTVKKDDCSADSMFNPSTGSFDDIGYESQNDANARMMKNTEGEFYLNAFDTAYKFVGQFYVDTATEESSCQVEYYAKGYTFVDNEFKNTYNPTGSGQRNRVTSIDPTKTSGSGFTSGTSETSTSTQLSNIKTDATFTIREVYFRHSGQTSQYRILQGSNSASIDETIQMVAVIVPTSDGWIKPGTFALKAKKDNNHAYDDRWQAGTWQQEKWEDYKSGLQIYSKAEFEVFNGKARGIVVGSFRPDEITSTDYFGITEYYAKGYVIDKSTGKFSNVYNPTSAGSRNRVYVTN